MFGLTGNDILVGGNGNDVLTGGSGADDFQFNSPVEGIDSIVDFDGLQNDQILISQSNFGGGLSIGSLDASQFTLGATASDANHRFVYDDSNGDLFFDIDGNGNAAQIQIATLTNKATLTASDFQVVL